MKQFVGVAKIIVIVLVALLVVRIGLAQEATESRAQKLDTRIWSQSYWLDMAKLGFVEVAPEVPLKEAVYTSSRIDAPGVVTDDSPDVPVTDDPNTTQSENSVFIHPLDINILLNSNNSTDWPVNVLYGADALYTTDGGATWDGQIQGAGGFNSGDPAAVIGRNGWYYVGYIADNYGQGVAHSTDGGNSWTHVQVAGGGYILDKNHLWIDNSLSSPYEGNLYSAWTNFQGGANDGEIELSRSTDEGLSWSASINISSAVSAGSHNQGVNIETGPNGEVYVAWSIYDYWPSDETAIGFTRSTDGGATFEPATRIIENIRGIRYTLTSKNMRVNSFPVMSVDLSGGLNSGTIYLVWTNIGVPGVNVGPDIDIYMIKSIDGGSTWSAPLKVNQDSSGLGKEHYFPWITCDPALGALSVIFYDDRNVSSTDCEVFVASSVDAGATWIDFKVSDVSFTPSPIPGLAGGYFGDYLGISARGGKVYPAWTDNRDGRAMTYVSPFALEEDTIPPASVTDLAVAEVGSNWITLTWTASGDDGDSGKATAYDIRYSTSLIDSINFDLATPVSNPPFPQEAGFTEVFTVDGLDFNTTYYFALKVYDEWGNISGVSNCPSETTLGIPDIVVSPDSLVDSLLTGETSIHILTIRNVGEGTLDFFFPQFDGEAALRLTSVEGDRLSFQMIPHMTEDIPWLSVYPTKGTVLSGESTDIEVTFDASGLYGGDYFADIIIASNDPDEPEVIVPAHLHVTGAPDIVVSEDTLDYGIVFIGASVTDTLIVSNEGTDLLTVSDIVSDNSDYTVDTTSFSLLPEESQEVLVTFTPSTTGQITGTLTITSDDPDEPIVTVFLHGEGAEPPDIFVTPDSLSDSLFTGETSTQWLTIYNEGFSDLIFDISIENMTKAELIVLSETEFMIKDFVNREFAMPMSNSASGEKFSPEVTKRIYKSSTTKPSTRDVNILVMEEIGAGIHHYDTALNNLGLSRTFVTSWSALQAELTGGTEWYLVIVNSYSNFPSPSVLDDLNDYISTGGRLMYADWAVYNYPGHNLLQSLGISFVSDFTTPKDFSAVDNTHQIFKYPNEVDSFYWTDDQANRDGEIVDTLPGASQLAAFEGFPNSGAVVLSPSNTCIFNAFQAANFNGDHDLDGKLDIVELIENEITLLLGGVAWLSVFPTSGTVPADSSIDIEVTFDATGLYGGDYFADIVISSNDPDEPEVTVPAHLHVTGAPDIVVSEDTLDYGIVFIGASVTDTLIVSNEGTDLLTVSDIVSDHSDYTVDTTSFSLAPGERQDVLVTFTPSTTGQITGTLTITSDDPDEPVVTVFLHGEGAEPPDIFVTPDSLSDSLFTGETSTQWLTIYNEGVSDLIFDITIEEPDTGRGGVHIRSRSFRRNPDVGLVSQGSLQQGNNNVWSNKAPFGYQPRRTERSGITRAGDSVLVIQDAAPWGSTAHEQVLAANGIDYYMINSSDIGSVDFSNYKVVLIPSDQPTSFYETVASFSDKFDSFVESGGILEFHAAGWGWNGGNASLVTLPGGMNINQYYSPTNYVLDPSHPLVQGVPNPFTGTDASHAHFTNIPVNALEIVEDDGGNTNLVEYTYGSGVVIAGGQTFEYGYDNGESAGIILTNLIPYAFYFEVGISWLSVDPGSGTVPADSSIDIEVTFDATGLYGGDYYADIIISSNDPDEPEVVVPAHLHVTGAPDIVVSEDTLDYGIVFVGASVTDTLIVSNEGTDLLTVSDIVSDNSDYTVDTTSFSLPPGEHQEVLVTFTPSTTGQITGTLTITSDDPDEPIITVFLRGEGAEPPDIFVTPDSLSDSLFTGETSIHWLTIYNEGVSDLIFDISIEEVPGLSINGVQIKSRNFSRTSARINPLPQLLTMSSDKKYSLGHAASRGRINPGEIELGNEMTVNLEILLLVSGGDPSEIQTLLLSYLDISVVDVFDASGTTPILDDLVGYHTVIVMNDIPFYDPVGVGDVLADYVDAGGGVVLTIASFASGWEIQGRLLDEGYMPFNIGFGPVGPANLGSFNPSHPIMEGVTAAWGDLLVDMTIAGGAELIAEWDNGLPFVATKGSSVAGVNIFVVSSGYWTGDIPLILHNAAFWSSAGVSWLFCNPTSGTIPADSSIDIEVTFDATGLYGGDYYADIIISSNDPDEPEVVVPAHLQVTGAPDIAVSEDTLDYGIVFVGVSVTDTLIVSNEGTDLLTVSDIVSDNSDYTVDTTSFSLPPGEHQEVLVTFTPSTTGQITGTLTITSDDPDEPTITVALIGEGLMPPIMTVNPDSMSDTLYTGESAVHIMTIGNIGGSDLVFEITEEPREGMKLSSREISPILPHSSLRPKETRKISLLNQYVKHASQKFIESPHGQKWGRNNFSASGTPLLLAGTYTGDYVHFGLSDYGEIMPFQYPVGTEHLRVGGYYSGYTVCYNNGTDHVVWAGYDDRWGIVPVSYTEVVNNFDEAIIDVVTQTSGGEVTITQRFTFDKHDKFILIETNLENTSGGALTDVVFKKWADWDMDNDFDDDNWDYDSTHNMIYAWDVHYGTIAGETPPDYRDIDGWDDYSQRITDEDYPNGPVTYFDGLEILHYELGALSPSEATALSFAYGAADGLSELQEVIERAMVRVEWLSAYPDTGTVPAGGSAEIEVTFDASGMYGGDYAAYLLISSNDPATPVDTVPCFLHVIAAPDIELSTDTLHFDTVLVGFSDTLELQVYNTGVETLLVTSVISDNPDYTVDTANFFVPADDSQTVRVIFTPDDEGLSTGNLAIESNDPDEPTVTVVLIGNGKTGIAESETEMVVPKNFSVSQICPNPFSRHAVIHYACPYRSTVTLKIYDVAGKLVRTLLSENSEAGYYTLIWGGRDNAGEKVSSGVYFLKFTAENYSATRKLHVIR